MIGGIIVLALLLTALVAMVVVTGAYDVYQAQVAQLHRKSDDRYSEQLHVVSPGIIQNNRNCPSSVTCYIMTVNNLGIGVRVARIYVNSTGGGCKGLCVLDPATSPSSFKFSAADAYINPGEFLHQINFWMPNTWLAKFTWPDSCTIAGVALTYGCSSVSLVTARGRVFAFQYPIPIAGLGGKGGAGGTGIYIGPVVYTFQKPLIAYTTASELTPQIPIGGSNGYWKLPLGLDIILYIKLQTDNGTKNDVYLTAQSILQFAVYTNPGQANSFFYIIAPINLDLCYYFQNIDRTIVCKSEYGYYPVNGNGNTGDPTKIRPYVPCSVPNAASYSSCANRYKLPKPNSTQAAEGQRGNPVIVAFGINKVCVPNQCPDNQGYAPASYSQQLPNNVQWRTNSAMTFLGLTYPYDDGSGGGAYFYGVTLPFIAVCTYDPSSATKTCPG
jgi:hypothetical protein